MRFVHTSDWHLGYSQYNRNERFTDFVVAANSVVEQIIQLSPDFVLHTGDLFHFNQPIPGAIRVAYRLLKKLKDAGIPVYIIRGNHDTKETARGGTVMNLLSDLGVITYVKDTVVYPLPDVAIIGVNYHPGKNAPKVIDELLVENKDLLNNHRKFKILALHNFIEGQLENEGISLAQVSTWGVNYVGVGHYHIPWKKEKFNLYTPGSTEATSSNDWKREDSQNGITIFSSFLEIKAEKEPDGWSEIEVKTHKILVRPKISVEFESGADDERELLEEIKEVLDRKRRELEQLISSQELKYKKEEYTKPVLSLKVYSKLPAERIALLDMSVIDRDYLHTNIYIEPSEISIQPYVEHTVSLVENTVNELIEEMQAGDDEFTKIVHTIMSKFQDEPPSRYRNINDDMLEEFVNLVTAGRDEK